MPNRAPAQRHSLALFAISTISSTRPFNPSTVDSPSYPRPVAQILNSHSSAVSGSIPINPVSFSLQNLIGFTSPPVPCEDCFRFCFIHLPCSPYAIFSATLRNISGSAIFNRPIFCAGSSGLSYYSAIFWDFFWAFRIFRHKLCVVNNRLPTTERARLQRRQGHTFIAHFNHSSSLSLQRPPAY